MRRHAASLQSAYRLYAHTSTRARLPHGTATAWRHLPRVRPKPAPQATPARVRVLARIPAERPGKRRCRDEARRWRGAVRACEAGVAHTENTDRASIAIRTRGRSHGPIGGTLQAQRARAMLNAGTSLRMSDASDRTIGTGSIGAPNVRAYLRLHVDNNDHGRAMHAGRFMKRLSFRGAR